jgi:DNA-binding HxlR family transcriptional regulator
MDLNDTKYGNGTMRMKQTHSALGTEGPRAQALARTAPCPVVRFNALAAGKYKLRILWELRAGPRRYSEIQRALVDATGGVPITPRVLSRELRQLAEAALVDRQAFPEVPPRVEYRMTPGGRAMLGVLRAICRWGDAAPGARHLHAR